MNIYARIKEIIEKLAICAGTVLFFKTTHKLDLMNFKSKLIQAL